MIETGDGDETEDECPAEAAFVFGAVSMGDNPGVL